MRVKEESEKAGLKFNIQKMKIMASSSKTGGKWKKVEAVTDFLSLGSKITAVNAAIKLKDADSLKEKL